MILTTNRVTVFDEAVQSRIHLGIKYDQLSKKAKAEIWTAFIQQANKVSTTGKGAKLSPKQVDDLSRREFNGRQVKTSAISQKSSLLIIECRSRTQSAWPTLLRQLRAHHLDMITSWRPLKQTRTLTMTSEERGSLRAPHHISRDIPTCPAQSNASRSETVFGPGSGSALLFSKSTLWRVGFMYRLFIIVNESIMQLVGTSGYGQVT